MSKSSHISLRGVRVHNLQSIDLDLPRRKLIVFCGLSGSGKSSLALDTLYAEGQRRYIESFSAYTRQFLERLERPDADRIDGIPPAMAVSGANTSRSNRSTVGTATEINDYLRLLMAKIGRVFCLRCGREVRRDNPQSAAEKLADLPQGAKFIIAFQCRPDGDDTPERLIAGLRENGFIRAIIDGKTVALDAAHLPTIPPGDSPNASSDANGIFPMVDRLVAGRGGKSRLIDSLETAFSMGRGRCSVFVEQAEQCAGNYTKEKVETNAEGLDAGYPSLVTVDGRTWQRMNFGSRLACDDCGIEYPTPEAAAV